MSNQSKSLSSVGLAITKHLPTILITPTASPISLQNSKWALTLASDTAPPSTLKISQNFKIEYSTVA